MRRTTDMLESKQQVKQLYQMHSSRLVLKMPRESASENIVCLCRLLNILCKLFKPIFAYRQTAWTLIRLLLEEQSDLGPQCLQQ